MYGIMIMGQTLLLHDHTRRLGSNKKYSIDPLVGQMSSISQSQKGGPVFCKLVEYRNAGRTPFTFQANQIAERSCDRWSAQ